MLIHKVSPLQSFSEWRASPQHLSLDTPRFVLITNSTEAGVLYTGFPMIILVQDGILKEQI
jgi:hypothetical protein